MEHREHADPDNLLREDWNSLRNNYDKHDVGQAYFCGRVNQIGLEIEHWGIDEREQDEHLIFDDKMDLRLWEPHGEYGRPVLWPSDTLVDPPEASGVAADGGLPHEHEDYDPATGEQREWTLRGVADVKTKANPDWLGKFNLRHLAHYAYWADAYDVPVFLYFTMVDMEAERVGEEDFIVPIEPFDNYEQYIAHFDRDTDDHYDWSQITEDCPYVYSSFRAPDGNPVVEIDAAWEYSFDWLVEEVL